MHLTLVFWLALMLPGYVLVRRFSPDDLRSGLLGTVGLSYVAVLGLLSPVSILCYLLHAPVAVFTGACGLAIVAAVVELTRRRWWTGLGRLLVAALSVELVIVLADLVMGARIGAHLDGDTRVHLARIRFILEHGFNNYDPFIAGTYFFPIYHTNILHAVYAACGQLTGVDHFGVWFSSLVWAKLMVASGIYFLAWSVFERTWPAWLAAVYVVGLMGPVNFIIYPNKLAPLWLLPMLVAFGVQALAGRASWRSCVKLGIGSVLLGQVHGLYAVVGLLVLVPVLAIAGAVKLFRKRPGFASTALCTVALLAALPFPLASKLGTPMPVRSPGAAQAQAPQRQKIPGFIRIGDDYVMRDPQKGFTKGGAQVAMLMAGMAISLIGSRRRHAGVLIAVVGVMILILYTPPLCTAVLAAVGQPWIMGRFDCILRMGLAALLIPGLAFWLGPKLRFWWARGLVAIGVLFLGIAAGNFTKMHNWTTYRQRVLAGSEQRMAKLVKFRNFRDVFEEFIPPGETILSTLEAGLSAVMLYDCHIVAGARASNGVPDIGRRRADVRVMLPEETPWPQRRELLRKYGRDGFMYLWPSGLSAVPEWARVRTHKWRDDHNLWLMRVTVD